MPEKKSDNYYIAIPEGISRETMLNVVERAVESVDLYTSHIGRYMAHKHPGSIHWHFKRGKKERGILDATFYDTESLFWLMIGRRNPQWVMDKVPELIAALEREFSALHI